MSVPTYSHILFDHDGVLVNTEPLYFRATQQVLAELGIELKLHNYLVLQADGGDVWAVAMVVEDSQRGLNAAVAAGIDCAAVFHEFTAPQNFDTVTYHIENLQHLVEMLT